MLITFSSRAARLAVACAVAGLLLTGCAPASTESATARPTLTPVPLAEGPSPSASPTAGPVQVGRSLVSGYRHPDLDVFEVARYPASEGCGCRRGVMKDEPELYPAGTEVIVMKVTVTATGGWRDSRADMLIPGLVVHPVFVEEPRIDSPALEETPAVTPADGKMQAARLGLTWLDDAVFPERIPNGESRSYAVAYYLPPGARVLDLRPTGWVEQPRGDRLESTLFAEFTPAAYYVAPDGTRVKAKR